MLVICKNYPILYEELDHPQILVSSEGPETNPPYVLRDDCILIP